MKNFFTKIGRFFWSWGFLKFVLWTITLIVFFYVEEDWRGARAWIATKAEWEAKGESFDLNKFIPPPVPDDQNLAAIPLFKLEPVKNNDGSSYISPVTLQRAMRSDLPTIEFPRLGNWMRGESPDMAKTRSVMAADFSLAFKGAKPPDDTLVQFDAIFPFLTDLRGASATRPLCRFNQDYTTSPPSARPLGLVTYQIKLSQILTLHAVLALDHHQSDLALEDIKLNYKLLTAVKRDPTLVGGLVAIGMNAINRAAIYNGLAQHLWSDPQLAEIDHTLAPINFLADYQFAMRCEAAESTTNFDIFKQHASRSVLRGFFSMLETDDVPLMTRFAPPWPDGWWDENKSQMIAFHFHELTAVDPPSHRVFPQVALDLQHQVDRGLQRWDATAPWNILFTIAMPPQEAITQKYAIAQVWVDEARIACALERYRLAHGVYPDSLDALAPIDSVPHDIINGSPYHYQLRPDGTFLLYSVGWNQTDEGGKVVYKKDAPTQIDYNEGDWAWPTPQAAPAK